MCHSCLSLPCSHSHRDGAFSCRAPDSGMCWLFPFGTCHGVGMAWGIRSPEDLGALPLGAAGEEHSPVADQDQDRVGFTAPRPSPGWFSSVLHVWHIGNMGCFFSMEQNNENSWKNPSYVGQDSLIKENCAFRCFPLFPALPHYLTPEKPRLCPIRTPGLFFSGNPIKSSAWASA